MRGVIIAGTHSGCGKTTATLGVMAALRKKGLTVQPFKTGPDFIDAGLHRIAAGRASRNLDQWMCGGDYVVDCFQKHASASDIAVIEGVMGMYDGDFSTASLARLLRVPVILVVDAFGMAESAGAIVHGFKTFRVSSFESGASNIAARSRSGKTHPVLPLEGEGVADKDKSIAGVIFNRVASDNHYKRLKDSVRDVPVLGYLPRELKFEIPHRHLGLATAEEGPITGENIDRLADTVLKYIEIDNLLSLSSISPPLQGEGRGGDDVEGEGKRRFRIAVAYDKAFCFYYEDNLDLLRDAGAGIVRFSPLTDRCVPENADAVYIGGGYPELHAEALAANTSMLASVKAWSEAGKPLYAECGGLMYLSQGIRDFDDRTYRMAGVFPFDARMLKKPKLAYREIVLNKDCILGTGGERVRGHEFHYSEIVNQHPGSGDFTTLYSVRDKNGNAVQDEGFLIRNTLASYVHVHFGSNPKIAERFVTSMIK